MPRGHYDRSHLKAKRAAVKAGKAAQTATVAAGIALSAKSASHQAASTPIPDTGPLREQLVSLTQTRGALCNNQVAFNAALVGLIDAEITAIVKSMAAWREAVYPNGTTTAVAKAPTVLTSTATGSVVPGLTPLAGPPPAPLPFTPQAVQELQKSVGQAS